MASDPSHQMQMYAKADLDELEELMRSRFGPTVTTSFVIDYAIKFVLSYERRPRQFIDYLKAERDLPLNPE